MDAALGMFRFATFAGAALLFGLVPFALLVLRPAFAALPVSSWALPRRRLATRLRIVLDGCLGVVAVAAVGTLTILTLRGARLHGGGLRAADVAATLGSGFGVWTVLRLVLVLGVVVAARGQLASRLQDDARDGEDRAYWIVWAGFAVAILATLSLSGHAATDPDPLVSVPVDLLHLLSASVWLTGVCLLTLAVPVALRGRRGRAQLHLLAPAMDRFSRLAFVAVLLVAGTGAIRALPVIGQLGDAPVAGYLQALVVKVWLFGGVLALGALNHFVLLRRLRRAGERGRHTPAQADIALSVALEMLFAIALLAVTALLTGLAPPR